MRHRLHRPDTVTLRRPSPRLPLFGPPAREYYATRALRQAASRRSAGPFDDDVPAPRRSDAGFTLVEAVFASVIMLGGLLLLSGLLGAEAARTLLNERQEVGREWAKTGLSDLKARAKRSLDTTPQTRPATIGTCVGCQSTGNGTALKTDPDGWGTWGLADQQITGGDGYAEFTPPQFAAGFTLGGPYGYRNISIGWGGWMGIYENGVEVAQTAWGAIPVHLPGDGYRIEWSGTTWKYYKIRGGTRTLIWTTNNPSNQPGYPLGASFGLYYQNNQMQSITLHGVLTDPLYLPDGGTVTPVGPCIAPYCDYVWRAPRTGDAQPAPQALAPGAAPPSGSELLFVRRFRLSTIDATRGVREITMSLALSESADPFDTLTTRVGFAH